MRYALIKNGLVENVAEGNNPDVFKGFDDVIDVNSQSVSPGWSYDGLKFSAPPLTPEQIQKKADAEDEELTRQTKLAECDSIKEELRTVDFKKEMTSLELQALMGKLRDCLLA